MKTRITFAIVLFIAVSALTMHGAANNQTPPATIGISLDLHRLGAMSRTDLEKECINILHDRNNVTDQLVDVMRNPASKNEKLAAIFLVGAYRLEGAAGPLSNMIDFHDDDYDGQTRPMPLLTEYPAADALVHIEHHYTVSWMLHNLATSDAPAVRVLSAIVLRDTVGTNCAKEAIRQAISDPLQGKDAKCKARLNAALDLIDHPQEIPR